MQTQSSEVWRRRFRKERYTQLVICTDNGVVVGRWYSKTDFPNFLISFKDWDAIVAAVAEARKEVGR